MSSISPVFARILWRELQRQGASEKALFADTNLQPASLWQLAELPLAEFLQIMRNAEALETHLPLGFLIGQFHNTAALGRLGVAMNAAPNIRAGLQLIGSYTRLYASYVRVDLIPGLKQMSLQVSFTEPLADSFTHHAEATLLFLQGYIEHQSGRPLKDACYLFSYRAPEYQPVFASYFHSPCRFGQQVNALELPKHWLEMPSPYFDAELWGESSRRLAQRLRELGASDGAVYTRHIRALLRSYAPSLPALGEIAERLNMSERTLNRRLGQEGSSFRELRGQLLNELARQHLRDTDASVEAIAATLGYQDAANFRRAFRTHTGLSPSDYRGRDLART